MEKVYFSHLESPTDREARTPAMQIDYMIGTMERGSYVSLNGFCYPTYMDPDEVGEMVKQSVVRGYGHKMLLSLDWWWKYVDGKLWFVYQEKDPGYVGVRNWAFLMTHVVPYLHDYGVPQADIEKMLRDNVHNLFS